MSFKLTNMFEAYSFHLEISVHQDQQSLTQTADCIQQFSKVTFQDFGLLLHNTVFPPHMQYEIFFFFFYCRVPTHNLQKLFCSYTKRWKSDTRGDERFSAHVLLIESNRQNRHHIDKTVGSLERLYMILLSPQTGCTNTQEDVLLQSLTSWLNDDNLS